VAKKEVSVWGSNRFWQRSAAWVTGFSAIILLWLTFDTVPQITMGTEKDIKDGVTKRVPSPTVINYSIAYEMSQKRGHEVPVIGGNDGNGNSLFAEKEKFFGRDDYSEQEAADLLHLGKLGTQAKNCMDCHTLLGNGAYYAPDLTKAWLDPMWSENGPYRGMTGKATKEEAMAEFLMHPSQYPTQYPLHHSHFQNIQQSLGLKSSLKAIGEDGIVSVSCSCSSQLAS